MANGNDRLVWIDCEMTGLDVANDQLVEIAIVITDFELTILDPGLDIVIKPDATALDNMSEFVRGMHASSGLLDAIPDGMSLDEAQDAALAYIRRFVPVPQTAPLAGNTIGTDRAFLARYMPRVYFNAPEKGGGHRALADILESIRELEYYRRTAIVADPGPTTDEALAAAASVVEDFAARL